MWIVTLPANGDATSSLLAPSMEASAVASVRPSLESRPLGAMYRCSMGTSGSGSGSVTSRGGSGSGSVGGVVGPGSVGASVGSTLSPPSVPLSTVPEGSCVGCSPRSLHPANRVTRVQSTSSSASKRRIVYWFFMAQSPFIFISAAGGFFRIGRSLTIIVAKNDW